MWQSDWVEAGVPPQFCQLSHRPPLVGIPSVSGGRPDLTPHVPRPWAVGVRHGVKQPRDADNGSAMACATHWSQLGHHVRVAGVGCLVALEVCPSLLAVHAIAWLVFACRVVNGMFKASPRTTETGYAIAEPWGPLTPLPRAVPLAISSSQPFLGGSAGHQGRNAHGIGRGGRRSGGRPDLTPHMPRPWAVGVHRGVKQPWDAYIGRATGLRRAPYTGPGWATTYAWLGWSTRPRQRPGRLSSLQASTKPHSSIRFASPSRYVIKVKSIIWPTTSAPPCRGWT